MYKGFDVALQGGLKAKIESYHSGAFNAFIQVGKRIRDKVRTDIEAKIVSGKWVLSGSDIESNWFPQLQNHVFISHSHKDEDLALAMAGMLKHWYGLDVFVDSALWGYYAELENQIYNKIIVLRGISSIEKKIELRNSVVSHVHCMLTKSLIQMMDQCECLIFLNTPASIGIRDIQGAQETYSPWIYTEVEMSRMLRTHLDSRRSKHTLIRESTEHFALDEDINGIISYPLNLDHLSRVDEQLFWKWIRTCAATTKGQDAPIKPFVALDVLYKMV